MAAGLRKYIEDPIGSVARKASKLKNRTKAKGIYLIDSLNGKYTSKTIDIAWDAHTRMDLINRVISEMGYDSYLEIGCHKNECFDAIRVRHKIGVDPSSGGTHRMTSDQFFVQNKETFDCIFIDGLHVYEQVRKDIINAVACLNANGTILMHDCLPTSYWAQATMPIVDTWNGDTWKTFVEVRTWEHIDSRVCLIDHGVGIIRKRPNPDCLRLSISNFKQLRFNDLADHYPQWLRVMRYDEAMTFVKT